MIIGSDIEKVRIFCKTPTYKNWSSLSKESKKILIDFSKKESSGDKSYKKAIKDNTSAYKHIENLESNLAALQLAIAELSTKQSVHIIETSEKIDNMVKNIQKFDRQNTHEDVMAAIMALRTEIDNKFYAYSTMLQSINDQTANDVSTLQVSNNGENQALVNQIRTLQAENENLANNSELLSSMVKKYIGNDSAILKDLEILKKNENTLVKTIKSGDLSKVTKSFVNTYRNSLFKVIKAIGIKQNEQNRAAQVKADKAKEIQAKSDKRAAEVAKAAAEEKKKKEAETVAKLKQEEERKRKEAEATAKLKQQEEDKKRKDAEAAAKKREEEEARLKAEAVASASAEAAAKVKQQQETETQKKVVGDVQKKKALNAKVKSDDPRNVIDALNENQHEYEGVALSKTNLANAERKLAQTNKKSMKNEEVNMRKVIAAETALEAAEAEAAAALLEAVAKETEAAADAILEADEAEKASASANTSILDYLKQQDERAAIDTDERVDRLEALPKV
jgi:hypothetical protein